VKLVFHDYGLASERLPDKTFSTAQELDTFIEEQSTGSIMGEFECENGFKIDIGIDENLGMVQYFSIDGNPPYFMALSPTQLVEGSHDFIMTGAPSEILGKHCLSLEVLKKIVMDFFETGEKSCSVTWEEC
jgi:hypothetical protein